MSVHRLTLSYGALFLLLWASADAIAQDRYATQIPTTVPIQQTVMHNGQRRYTVTTSINSFQIDAVLDTGSVGLRVLSRALPFTRGEQNSPGISEAYWAGIQLDGYISGASVSLGELSDRVPIQIVTHVSCTALKPHCREASVPFSDYRIMRDGVAGQGFDAIVGIRMGTNAVANPLNALGVYRWIVDLPAPDQQTPGALILNPDREMLRDYVPLPTLSETQHQRGPLHDAIAGCLTNDRTHQKICGAVVLDTGAAGIHVISSTPLQNIWADDTPASLQLMDASGDIRATAQFMIDPQHSNSRVVFQTQSSVPMTIINAGITPYFAFSVYYDELKHSIGFKPRSAAQMDATSP